MAGEGQVAPTPPEGQGQGQQAGIGQVIGVVARLGLMYAFMMWMRSGKDTSSGGSAFGPDVAGKGRTVVPYFYPGQLMHMHVYLSTSSRKPNGKQLWNVHDIPLCEKNFKLEHSVNLTADDLSKVVQDNRTTYLVTEFLVSREDQETQKYDYTFIKSIPLVSFQPPQKSGEGRSLLGGSQADVDDTKSNGPEAGERMAATLDGVVDEQADEDDAKEAQVLWIPYFKPNITISMVDMFAPQNANRLPPNMEEALEVTNDDKYYPLIHLNDFWVLKDYMIPVNETTQSVELHLEVNTASNMYWMMISTFDIAMETNRRNGMGGEMEELKRVFLEGNPYFLFLTFLVSLLHSVFDMLAFKNDIGFWRSNKSMEGLSAKTIIINAFCQVIIFLYLLDNETSTVVLLSAGFGVLIEFWKITRVMDVSIEAVSGKMPKLKIAHRNSYLQSDTKKHDDDATKYMSYALFPMIVAYFGYSLIYDKHKSWYSFVVQSLVGCVYAFGFVLMCPQLYLNYKLKSVAHLPWRQMTYKFLNTIVDDLGAFIIKMPLLHRLAVFRDDVVFLIYLYQRWIYRVDKNRVNEFGFTGDEGQKSEEGPALDGVTAPAIKDKAEGTSTATAAGAVTQRRGHAGQESIAKEGMATEPAKDK